MDVRPPMLCRQEVIRLRVIRIELAFVVGLVAGLAAGDERGKCHAAEYSAFFRNGQNGLPILSYCAIGQHPTLDTASRSGVDAVLCGPA